MHDKNVQWMPSGWESNENDPLKVWPPLPIPITDRPNKVWIAVWAFPMWRKYPKGAPVIARINCVLHSEATINKQATNPESHHSLFLYCGLLNWIYSLKIFLANKQTSQVLDQHANVFNVHLCLFWVWIIIYQQFGFRFYLPKYRLCQVKNTLT